MFHIFELMITSFLGSDYTRVSLGCQTKTCTMMMWIQRWRFMRLPRCCGRKGRAGYWSYVPYAL